MRLLLYKDLDLKRVKPAFAKVRAAIEAGDFKSPDVKKLHTGGYYRAKLDHSNRLLLQFARHDGETVCLALEVIENHAYDKSRFLRGALVDDAKIEREPGVEAKSAAELEAAPLRWLHATRAEFELLDKPSDLFDVLAYVAFASAPQTRAVRAAAAHAATANEFTDKQRAFVDLVLAQYVKQGVDELDAEKLSPLLKLKYKNALSDAFAELGRPDQVRGVFVGFQRHLYELGISPIGR